MGSCFRALSGLRILKNTGTIWLVDSSALIYFSAKCPSTNATEKYNQYVLLEEKNFVVIYHCNSALVDMNKIQIKSIMNKYRGWTCRIHYTGNDSHS